MTGLVIPGRAKGADPESSPELQSETLDSGFAGHAARAPE